MTGCGVQVVEQVYDEEAAKAMQLKKGTVCIMIHTGHAAWAIRYTYPFNCLPVCHTMPLMSPWSPMLCCLALPHLIPAVVHILGMLCLSNEAIGPSTVHLGACNWESAMGCSIW